MKIKDLEANQNKVEIAGKIKEKGEVREFNKFGKSGRVCNCMLEDDSGVVNLTLWDEQIDLVNQGDNVRITNGYVKEWQGEKQLNVGRYGQLNKE